MERFSKESDKVDLVLDHLDKHPKAEVKLRLRPDKATVTEVFEVLTDVFGS